MLHIISFQNSLHKLWFAANRPLTDTERSIVAGRRRKRRFPTWPAYAILLTMIVWIIAALKMMDNGDHAQAMVMSIMYAMVIGFTLSITWLVLADKIDSKGHRRWDYLQGMFSGENASKGWYSQNQTAFEFVEKLMTPANLQNKAFAQKMSDYFVATNKMGLYVDIARKYCLILALNNGNLAELTPANFRREIESLCTEAIVLAGQAHEVPDGLATYTEALVAKMQGIIDEMIQEITANTATKLEQIEAELNMYDRAIETAVAKRIEITRRRDALQSILDEK